MDLPLPAVWRRPLLWAVARSEGLADLLYGPARPLALAGLRQRQPRPPARPLLAGSGDKLKFRQGSHEVAVAPPITWGAARSPAVVTGLHAMEFLHDLAARAPASDEPTAAAVVRDWLEHHAVGRGPAWEPWVAARRLATWALVHRELNAGLAESDQARLLGQVAVTARFLALNLERHRSGQRLADQARALILAGRLLAGSEPRQWCELGTETILRLLGDEVLKDGGHVSRRPQVHAAVLAAALDAVSALEAEQARPFVPHLQAMLRWLECLAAGDGSLPYAASGAWLRDNPRPELAAWASRLVGGSLGDERPAVAVFPRSGFTALVPSAEHGDRMVIDWGAAADAPRWARTPALAADLAVGGLGLLAYLGPLACQGRDESAEPRGHRVIGASGWGQERGLVYFEGEAEEGQLRHRRRVVGLSERAFLILDHLRGEAAMRALLIAHPETALDGSGGGGGPLFLSRGAVELTLAPGPDTAVNVLHPGGPGRGPSLEVIGRPGHAMSLLLVAGRYRGASVELSQEPQALRARLAVAHRVHDLVWPLESPPRLDSAEGRR